MMDAAAALGVAIAALVATAGTNAERRIENEVEVPAGILEVWQAWTTEAGARTFFAPEARIGAAVGGPYELYFDPSRPEGLRGSEGMVILALQPERMLSFTWNGPPELPELRAQRTVVTVRLAEVAPGRTRVRLVHSGWGEGGEWDEGFAYFERAWDLVLGLLVERFASGPVDWSRRGVRG